MSGKGGDGEVTGDQVKSKAFLALPGPSSGNPVLQPYLDVLELGERRPKGIAALSVFHGTIEGGLGNAQSLGGDADAAHVQGLL